MSLTKITASMLSAGVLALSVACSGSRTTQPEATPFGAVSPGGVPSEVVRGPGSSEPVATLPLALEEAPSSSAAETLPPAREPPLRKSPMQALNQMVTAQALLVSLLLAPLSKGAAEEPLARVDAPRASAPRR